MNAKQKEQTIEEIKKLLEENNGIVKAEKLYPLGLTYKSIQGLVKAGILDHVKSGYYSMRNLDFEVLLLMAILHS